MIQVGRWLSFKKQNMRYNKNSGWGQSVMASLPFLGSGKVFAVGDSGTANRDILTELFDVDPDGAVRFFATVDAAINATTANAGDTIFVMPGHTETIATASGITSDVAGVSIIGLGEGDNRPTFSFSATASTWVVSGASTVIKNIVGVPSIDSVVSGFVVSGSSCDLDIEWADASSTVEAVRAVLTTAAADDLKLKLRYIGNTGGNACVNAARIVGGAGARIDVDFYGVASTGVVEFLTTPVVDCVVTGYQYNSGTTDFTKSVVDTVTGSTWFAAFEDGGAGAGVSGGSGNALAAGDLSAIATAVQTTIPALHTVPTVDGTADTNMRDVIGRKTDAAAADAVTSTESLMAYAKQNVTNTEFLSGRVTQIVTTSPAVMADNDTLFTVAGGPIIILELFSICAATNDATASTIAYKITPTIGSEQTISAASASIANAAAGATIALQGTALSTAALYNANGPNLIANPGTIICPAGTIDIDVAVGSTTGTWVHVIRYVEVDENASVS